MKSLPLILIVSMIVIGSVAAIRYIDNMSPSWQTTEAVKNAQRIRESELAIEREREYNDWYTNNIGFFYGGLMVVGFTAAGAGIWWVTHKRIEQSQRQINGSYALQWRTVGGVKTLIDPNKIAGGIGALTVDNVLGSKPYFDNPEQQLRLLEQENKKRLMQAMPEQQIRYSATGKFLAGAYDRPIKPAEYHVVENEVPLLEADFERLSLDDAFSQSKKGEWIIGQNPDDGELCRLNIESLIHHAIVGASGTGKTSSTGLLEMANAVRDGYHVIALDGVKQAVDWEPYYKHIEPVECNYGNFLEYIQGIENINHERQTIIKQAGVRNINELKSKKMAKLLIIIEEFGSMMRKLKENDASAYKLVASKLENLLSVGRSNGLSFCLIDQNPSKWPGGITANITNYVAYRVGGKKGNAIDEYHLKDLKRTGQFFYEESKYDSWFTLKDIDKLLYGLPERQTKLLRMAEPVLDDIDINDKNIIDITPSSSLSSTSSAGSTTGDKSSKPVQRLDKEPETELEKQLVYDTYKQLKNKTETCKALWGAKNGKTWEYLNNVITEFEA